MRVVKRLSLVMVAEKYGVADWWIGWLADTSRSIAIRLTPQ